MSLPRTPGMWKRASRPVWWHVRRTRPHKCCVSTKTRALILSHTHTRVPTAVLSGRDVGALAATETHRFNLESCDTALCALEHAARRPLFNNLRTPTVSTPTSTRPAVFLPGPNLCCLNWFLQLTLAPGASRSSWCSQKKPLAFNLRGCYPWNSTPSLIMTNIPPTPTKEGAL